MDRNNTRLDRYVSLHMEALETKGFGDRKWVTSSRDFITKVEPKEEIISIHVVSRECRLVLYKINQTINLIELIEDIDASVEVIVVCIDPRNGSSDSSDETIDTNYYAYHIPKTLVMCCDSTHKTHG